MKDHISICICTYRRNEMLERLLRQIALQERGGCFDFSVVVVDNDAAGPARPVVERARAELGLELQFGVEPERTIPAVRNHALRLAKGNYIGIIDDDEFPPPEWLLNLYRAIRTFEVDGGLGPVHPFFEQRPPEWLVKSGFCERPAPRTGTLLHWSETRTGNVLLKKDVFDKNGLCFDVKYKTGGSDNEFFRRAMNVGCRFIAVKEAPVYEIVPPERWSKEYYLRRALVNGYNTQRSAAREAWSLSRLVAPAKSAAAVVAYGVAAPVCAALGQHVLMNCLVRGGHHLSQLCAVAGIQLVKKRNF
jgi:succinoglycan biosynthesis protein ExoM